MSTTTQRYQYDFEVDDRSPDMGFTDGLELVGLAFLTVGYLAFFVTQGDGHPAGFAYIGLGAVSFLLAFLVDVAFAVAERDVTSLACSVGVFQSRRVSWLNLLVAFSAANFLFVCLG